MSDGDTGYANTGDTNYPNSAVEPSVAANPRSVGTGRINLIGVWQQDRWSSGGAKGIVAGYSFDGGITWGQTPLPFSACASQRSPFVRASDPWVSIGADGTAYVTALGFSSSVSAILETTSTDGGRSWGPSRAIIMDRTVRYENDKPSITADPARPGVAYATWNRTQQPVASHHMLTWFARTTDGGRTWSAPRQIARALDGADAFGHQIVVDSRRHILYDVFFATTGGDDSDQARRKRSGDRGSTATSLIAFVKSVDAGKTWSSPRIIAHVPSLNSLVDFLYRLNYPGPAAAVDPATGKLFVVWTDSRVDQGDQPAIVLAASDRGGWGWSAPHRISGPGMRPAFTPAITVNRQGVIGVSYYSANQLYAANTDSDPHPPPVLVDAWFLSSRDGGRHFGGRVHLGGPFNYWATPFANGYFLGDYQGLAVAGRDFHPFFAMTTSEGGRNRTEVFTDGRLAVDEGRGRPMQSLVPESCHGPVRTRRPVASCRSGSV